jgi:hypothetical protein
MASVRRCPLSSDDQNVLGPDFVLMRRTDASITTLPVDAR